MRVLVTTLGRGHFIQVASSLIKAGVDAYLLQGWFLKNAEKSWLVKIAMKLLGRSESFVYGMARRVTPELEGRNIGDFWTEFIQAVLERTVGRINSWWWNWSVKTGFRLHGWKMARLVKRDRYDIIHVKSGLGRGGGIKAAKARGVKVLVDHSAGSPNFIAETVANKKLQPSSYWWIVQEDCDDADLLLVDCDWVRETFLMYGYPEEKIRVVYMGLDQRFNGLKVWDQDLSQVGKTQDKPLRIVFSGPFAEYKGNHDFLEAIDKLMATDLIFEVDVLGSVQISDADRQCFARAIEKIKFHGHLPQDKMCEVMRRSHVYLFPSLSEGCAKSAFEAMSMGLCIVASKQTGLPLTDGVDGHLIKIHDSDSIVKKIQWLVDNPAKISETGVAGVETMKKYTWAYYAENVKKVYDELLKEGK